jgi:hypothetical protein
MGKSTNNCVNLFLLYNCIYQSQNKQVCQFLNSKVLNVLLYVKPKPAAIAFVRSLFIGISLRKPADKPVENLLCDTPAGFCNVLYVNPK